MRFLPTKLVVLASVLSLALSSLSQGQEVKSKDIETMETSKAKAKALFDSKLLTKYSDTKEVGVARKAAEEIGAPVYVWVQKKDEDLQTRLPKGLTVVVKRLGSTETPTLVIYYKDKTIRSAEDTWKNPEYVKALIDLLQKELKNRPPQVETSTSRCTCPEYCICGCLSGRPCTCVVSKNPGRVADPGVLLHSSPPLPPSYAGFIQYPNTMPTTYMASPRYGQGMIGYTINQQECQD